MTIPIINVRVSLGVLLGYLISAAVATPSVGVIVGDVIGGKPVPAAVIEAAGIGIAAFLGNTLIHQKSQSSGPNAQQIAALHMQGFGPTGKPLPTPAVAPTPAPVVAPVPAAPVVPAPVADPPVAPPPVV